MKKNIAILATIATMIFSGCGDDRSHPKDGVFNLDGNATPTAVIDLNATTHEYSDIDKAYTIDRTNAENPFIFLGKSSHDNDENNQSIKKYEWNVSHTFSPVCIDVNKTSDLVRVHFANTDANTTCRSQAINSGEINATLTVTDDEGKTDSTTMSIKTN